MAKKNNKLEKLSVQELQSKIDEIKVILNDHNTPADIKSVAQETLDSLNVELQKRGSTTPPMTDASAAPVSPVQAFDNKEYGDKFLAYLATFMETVNQGGADKGAVFDYIKEYLDKSNVQLNQLSKEILAEIAKRQQIELRIPNLNKPIVLSGTQKNIPFIYEILDDVLSGNNVYLIGEAGSGKTYTAKQVAKILNRDILMINCSQYTSPVEIIGGQTIEGYQDGKLVIAWREGKILIIDEMPKIDPNTAGLFNDALAQTSKTEDDAKISSANPKVAPIQRHPNFAVIGTGNIYPNTTDPSGYVANNQQDLSLLDRFSGGVYFIDYSKAVDEYNSVYQFIYDILVGNWYDWNEAKMNNVTPPQPTGLRTVIKSLSFDNLGLVSYRTILALRVSFEIELARAIAEHMGDKSQLPAKEGKTFLKAFKNWLVAFTPDQQNVIRTQTGFTDKYIQDQVDICIGNILNDQENGLKNMVVKGLRDNVSLIMDRYKNITIATPFKD